MNPRTVGIILVVVGIILMIGGLFVKITYVPTVYDGVNGLILTTPHTVSNYFATFLGLGAFFFGVHLLLAKQKEPVTMVDEEYLKQQQER
ncbi:MAG: hypothetical protein QW688_04595 [Thermoprotei archaeon]